MINLDELAEMHYADKDPAYQNEDDLNKEKEEIENRALTAYQWAIKELVWSLDEAELHALAENTDELCAYLEEALEEFR